MPAVRIGSAGEYLRLSAVEWPGAGDPVPGRRFLKVELRGSGELWGDGVSAVRVVDLHQDAEGIQGFFDEIAEGWQVLPLDGGVEWRSFEGNLSIEARRVRPSGSPEHRGPDYVQFHGTLRDVRAWERDRWTATARLTIRSGEQLQAIARDVRALVGALG
jgi:hypothetical protein